MKILARLVAVAMCFIFVAGSAMADRKGRKLPVGAYLKSAKIEIVSGDVQRYQGAIAMLDSLFMHYGPHAEALHLMGQIMVDLIDRAPGPKEKTPYIEKFVAYGDSLHMCCEDKKIKKKYKKDCKKYTTLSDSLMVKYWRESYNSGIEQLTRVEELLEDIRNESDSLTISMLEDDLAANVDSCITNLKLAAVIDPADHRSYVGIGSLYERTGDFEKAIKWLKEGVEKADDRANLLLSIAYDYIKLDKYLEAIPFLKEYVDLKPTDVSNMYNLSICYNNCRFYDSALAVNRNILDVDAENTDALLQIGRYFSQMGRHAADSSSHYQSEDNEEKAGHWREKRKQAFDSSLVYFKKVVDLKPDDIEALGQYGLISYVNGRYEDAAGAFLKVTELDPDDADNWTSLGDSYFNLRQFQDAIGAYEMVTQLDPINKDIWERLKDLYHEVGDRTKEAEADRKLQSL